MKKKEVQRERGQRPNRKQEQLENMDGWVDGKMDGWVDERIGYMYTQTEKKTWKIEEEEIKRENR